MTFDPNADPFAGGESRPSVTFKDAPVGTTYTGTVTEAPQLVQARDFESGLPALWPDGKPKMTVVTSISIDGEERSLWAPKPSAMFRAIQEAQLAAGAKIAVGGTLTVTFTGEKPNKNNPRLNPQKLYSVSYVAPDAFAAAPSPQAAVPQYAAAAPQAAAVPQAAAAPAQGWTATPAQAPQAAPVAAVPQYTPEQIAAAKAAGIPLPGVA